MPQAVLGFWVAGDPWDQAPRTKEGRDWERLRIEGEFHEAGKRILGLSPPGSETEFLGTWTGKGLLHDKGTPGKPPPKDSAFL